MKVLGIVGSIRRESWNRKLLENAAELLPAGAELELWDGLKEVPPYNEDDDVEPAPAPVARFRAAIAGADTILIATPEYNSSIPGALKNAMSQAELRKVLAATGARVVEGEVAVGHAPERFDVDGRLTDEELRDQFAEVVELLVQEARPQQTLAAA